MDLSRVQISSDSSRGRLACKSEWTPTESGKSLKAGLRSSAVAK